MKSVLLGSLFSVLAYPAAEKEKQAQALSAAQFPLRKSPYQFSPTDKPSKYRTTASAQWIANHKKNTMTITVTPQMAQEMAAYVNDPKTPEGQETKPFNYPPKKPVRHFIRPESVPPLKLHDGAVTQSPAAK